MTLIVTADTLTQRQVEAFGRAYMEHKGERARLSAAEERGCTVRAAVSAGWLQDLTLEAVADLPPRAVAGLAREIDAVYAAAMAPDPKAS